LFWVLGWPLFAYLDVSGQKIPVPEDNKEMDYEEPFRVCGTPQAKR